MIRTVLCLHIFLLSAVAFANESVLRGLTLLSDGKKDQAARVLESVYENSKADEERFQAALTLAFLDSRYLKKHKLHEYAVYLLRKSRSQLEARDAPALLRVAGDGLFQAAELDAAETYYLELARSANSGDVDYAQFKLGWIDLNRAQPSRAFDRWYQRLTNVEKSDQQLRLSLMRDLGRAWAETVPPISTQVARLAGLSMDATERKVFLEGVVAGLRRVENISAFREELFKSDFTLEVFRGLLAQGAVLKNAPCEILPWLDTSSKVTPEHFETETILARLGMCQEDLRRRAPTAWTLEKTTERLLSVYEKTPLIGMQRQPRVYLYKDLGRIPAYCTDVLSLERENFERTGKSLTDAFLSEILTTCTTNPEREHVLAHVLAYPRHFKNTLFPALIVESFLEKERLAHGSAFLEQFAPRPLASGAAQARSVWVELLRSFVKAHLEHKNISEAHRLLTTYSPLENTRLDTTVGELWLLFALAISPEDASLKTLGEQVTQKHFNALSGKLSHQQSLMAITLANRFGLSMLVWSNWDRFAASALRSSELVSELLQRTFVQLLEKQIQDKQTKSLIAKTSMGQSLISTIHMLEQSPDQNLSLSTLKLDPQPAFVGDLRAIAKLREQAQGVSRLRLKLDSRLAKKVKGSVESIQKQMKLVNARKWSHPKLVQIAKRAIAESCERLNLKLKEIPEPAGLDAESRAKWREQFLSISGTIANWRSSLLEGA